MIHLFSITPNTPISERERLLKENRALLTGPGVLLQTCNRTEFYYGEGSVPDEIFEHLFRVVSGLESNLPGEIAIQGQVKAAYIEADAKFKLSSGLHKLFQRALHVGKQVRNHSGISRGAVSHSLAATHIISQSGINLNKSIISLIGAHKLNDDIIRFLQNKGAESFFLANKTFDTAQQMADERKCTALKLDRLPEILQFSDVLITATSAPHLIVKYDAFPKDKKMLIIDLAFPRDVDERIGQLPGVQLFNLDDVERFVKRNLELRHSEVQKAEAIIHSYLQV